MKRIVVLLIAALALILASVASAWAGGEPNGEGHTPVTICHVPPPVDMTLVVDDDAVPGHLGHGDYLGPCNPPPPPCLVNCEPPPCEDCVPTPTGNPPPPPPGPGRVGVCFIDPVTGYVSFLNIAADQIALYTSQGWKVTLTGSCPARVSSTPPPTVIATPPVSEPPVNKPAKPAKPKKHKTPDRCWNLPGKQTGMPEGYKGVPGRPHFCKIKVTPSQPTPTG